MTTGRMKSYVVSAVVTAQLLFMAAVLASIPMSRFLWIADLANFIRQHLAVAGLALFVAGFLLPGRLAKITGFLTVAAVCVPFLLVPAPATGGRAGTAITVVSANVDVHNPDPTPFLYDPLIAKADILVLQEVRSRWQDAVLATGSWPFESGRDLPANTDMKVVSRFPIVDARPVSPESSDTGGRHALRIELRIRGRTVVLYAVHPQSPRSPGMWRDRAAYFRDLNAALAGEDTGAKVIIAGDWNTAPWSPIFRDLLNRTGYQSTEMRWWPSPTRFSLRFGGLSQLGTPIDRIVVSPQIGLEELRIGAKFGSSHLPVIATLTIPD